MHERWFLPLHSEPCDVTVHAQGKKKKKNLKTQNLKTQTPNPNGIIIEQWKMKFVIELSLYDLRTAEEYLGGEDSFT